MQIRSKLALSLLAGTLALPSLFAQNPPTGSGPAGSGPGDGPPSQHRMGPGQKRGPDDWQRGEGERGDGRFHGMRGGHRGRGEFAIARLAEDPAAREKLGITAEQAPKSGRTPPNSARARSAAAPISRCGTSNCRTCSVPTRRIAPRSTRSWTKSVPPVWRKARLRSTTAWPCAKC